MPLPCRLGIGDNVWSADMLPGTRDLRTHRVTNQPTPLEPPDLWRSDKVLREYADAFGGSLDKLARAAAMFADPELRNSAADAGRDLPRLVSFARDGSRLDEVRFGSGYHHVMRAGQAAGYVSAGWSGQSGAHVTHAALVYMLTQVEPAICCPLTMSYAAAPVLVQDRALGEVWRPRLLSGGYDPSVAPASEKAALTIGMAMTEKQGGSDVRENTTTAQRDGEDYRLTGHKWFCSAPMSDGFVTLAQAPGGLTCFLLPRWLPDGRNAIRLMRLKDKLGNRANASAEIELDRALAWRLGEEGDGIRTIIEMVHHTRLDTALAPAGLMRAALREAVAWCEGRTAFQRRLIDQPLMRTVLADLALDWEAALALGLRVAAAFDDPGQRPFARIAVALAKFHANKRAPWVITEALECLGGMGYVEDTPLPMLYREAPLNGIWEGSGNVICLDVLRTLARVPEAREALRAELELARGFHPHFDNALETVGSVLSIKSPPESDARVYVERLACLLGASVLARYGPAEIAESYCASRLGPRGLSPGTAPNLPVDAILRRILPIAAKSQV